MLEIPVTWTMVRENRAAPHLRGFYPNAINGDPVSAMPAPGSGPPRVATYVSHSFELMRDDRDSSPEVVAAFKQRLRQNLPGDLADRLLEQMGPEVRMRVYDGALDDGRVAAAAGLLRRIADRPDARCVTYAELAQAREAWRDPRHQPVDPVPTLDRELAVASVTGTRVYTSALASHLAGGGEPSNGDGAARAGEQPEDAESLLGEPSLPWQGSEVVLVGKGAERLAPWLEARGAAGIETADDLATGGRSRRFDVLIWPDGLERCPPGAFEERLRAAAGMLRSEGVLLARVRTLGVTGALPAQQLPPLSELLFAGSEPAEGEDEDAARPDVVAWDVATFSAWFESRGWEALQLRRLQRTGAELAAIERFPDKLGALARDELETRGVDLALRRPPEPDGRSKRTGASDDPASSPAAADAALRELTGRFGVSPGDAVLVLGAGRRRRARSPDELGEIEGVTLERASPLDSGLKPERYDLALSPDGLEVGPERLDEASRRIRRSLRPGGELLLRAPVEGAVVTPTTLLVALLRAGFEVVETAKGRGCLDCRLVRPLELNEIARFAGRL